jgi:hypothetical protein
VFCAGPACAQQTDQGAKKATFNTKAEAAVAGKLDARQQYPKLHRFGNCPASTMHLNSPLSPIEVKALQRVGLIVPESLSLDDIIIMFLAEKAEVLVSPSSSSDLVGTGCTLVAASMSAAFFPRSQH